MTGQRLTIPEPEIELYEDGFDATDRGVADLGRKEDGKKLSDLVEKIAEPMVIAVDAPWGAGKSVFLKCWVGEHIKPKDRKTTTVYFDAFQHDFLDDPLIALTGVISERFEDETPQSGKWDKIKETAYRLRKPAARIGAAAVTGGVSELTAPVIDAVLDATNAEFAKASEAFWKKEDGKRAAMQGFRDALENLAADQKLVIVVDELDRCRPDYALNLLEVIKHFFNVENVHFVLGVNLTELENSVRARYGEGVNAGLYLQKFVTVTMRLGKPASNGSIKIKYFESLQKQLATSEVGGISIAAQYIKQTANSEDITLRGIQHFMRHLIISPTAWHPPYYHTKGEMRDEIRVGLIFLAAFYPKYISKVLNGEFDYATAVQLFQLPDPRAPQTTDMVPTLAWMACLGGSNEIDFLKEFFVDQAWNILAKFDEATVTQIWHEYVNVFQLPT